LPPAGLSEGDGRTRRGKVRVDIDKAPSTTKE
jgi:hypothetical protein